MSERIALVYRDGEWKYPDCDCAVHYFDGKPLDSTPPHMEHSGERRLTGKVAPHVHRCEKHSDDELSSIVRRYLLAEPGSDEVQQAFHEMCHTMGIQPRL